jgi:hypothetical protein
MNGIAAADAGSVGWIYTVTPATKVWSFRPNTGSATDSRGNSFDTY